MLQKTKKKLLLLALVVVILHAISTNDSLLYFCFSLSPSLSLSSWVCTSQWDCGSDWSEFKKRRLKRGKKKKKPHFGREWKWAFSFGFSQWFLWQPISSSSALLLSPKMVNKENPSFVFFSSSSSLFSQCFSQAWAGKFPPLVLNKTQNACSFRGEKRRKRKRNRLFLHLQNQSYILNFESFFFPNIIFQVLHCWR